VNQQFSAFKKTNLKVLSSDARVELLKNNFPTFKMRLQDPNACKTPIYIQGGIVGAGIVIALN
jgi:hypothetical protein